MLNFIEAVEITRRERRQRDWSVETHAPGLCASVIRPTSPSIPSPEVLAELSYSALLDLSLEVSTGILARETAVIPTREPTGYESGFSVGAGG